MTLLNPRVTVQGSLQPTGSWFVCPTYDHLHLPADLRVPPGHLLGPCVHPTGPAWGRPTGGCEASWMGITRVPGIRNMVQKRTGAQLVNLGTPLPLGRGVAGVLKVWGSGLETLLPCSQGSADKGTSCYTNLGNKGNSKCFLLIQVMAGDCFTGCSAPFFPSSALMLRSQLLHKAWLMKVPVSRCCLRKAREPVCCSHSET